VILTTAFYADGKEEKLCATSVSTELHNFSHHRPGVNQAECLACHKPLDNVSYTFTLKQLTEAK